MPWSALIYQQTNKIPTSVNRPYLGGVSICINFGKVFFFSTSFWCVGEKIGYMSNLKFQPRRSRGKIFWWPFFRPKRTSFFMKALNIYRFGYIFYFLIVKIILFFINKTYNWALLILTRLRGFKSERIENLRTVKLIFLSPFSYITSHGSPPQPPVFSIFFFPIYLIHSCPSLHHTAIVSTGINTISIKSWLLS